MPVTITNVATMHPAYDISQQDAAARITSYGADARRIAALARGSAIEHRALAIAPEAIVTLGSTFERNELYQTLIRPLAEQVARAALLPGLGTTVGCLVTSSCTGYASPSWNVRLAQDLGLSPNTMRLPINEVGCAGGVVALARAAEYLRAHPGRSGLTVSAELCSLAFHPGGDMGNVTATLIFGDGAGAAVLQTSGEAGLEIIDSGSWLIPDSEQALGFDLTDEGFYPVLSPDLADLLPGPCRAAIADLLERNCVRSADVGAWLLHPGGARILRKLEVALEIDQRTTRWSWDSLAEHGNTSSAAILDVIRRYRDEARPNEFAVVAAFGPGVSIELLLLRATC